ncbi:HAMP domain-containing sensor histidine kinase [Hyphobacterium sp. HN65]|uniref:histidine kinase n=1 Tax=Hyphobacterium lacteum TaxID=3116575 RepID=A0ABU7LSZ5_9PROT|nr:HAMP domain-containing sensor histidine kinase [Hyphobacterium sp. HN65]MEE2527042.1 HAMP domain-containing sensor histidine kinase [Hyphobacterium sp. HN65]
MRLADRVLNNGGRLTHLIWVAVLAAVAPVIIDAAPVELSLAIAGIAGALLPGIAGLFLAHRKAPPLGKLVLMLLWVSLAASAVAVSGGMMGPGAMVFILPVAAMASFANRRIIIETAALTGLTAILIGGLQLAGLLTVSSAVIDVFAPAFLAVLAVAFAGPAFSAARVLRRRSLLRSIARRHQNRSRAFMDAPVPLIATRNGEITATSKSVGDMMPGLPGDIVGLPLADLAFDLADRTAFETPDTHLSYSRIRGARGRAEDITLYKTTRAAALVPSAVSEDNSESTRRLQEERDLALAETRAKSEFLASVSHEIRTPLNAIIGFSDAMKSRLFGPIPAKYAEYADLIHESGRHLLELIGDVLDLSRIEAESYSLMKEDFNAVDVIELCTRMMSQRASEAGIEIEIDMPEALPVHADRKAIRQILLNLLSNAVKFTPKDGVIVVLAAVEGDQLTLAVGDSGPGIAQDELYRLGQRYQQASTANASGERGSGLGLSLVKALAEMHDGQMAIDSKVGEGTTVSVSMPVMTAAKDDGAPAEPLEVHSRIERAQTAGQGLISSAG